MTTSRTDTATTPEQFANRSGTETELISPSRTPAEQGAGSREQENKTSDSPSTPTTTTSTHATPTLDGHTNIRDISAPVAASPSQEERPTTDQTRRPVSEVVARDRVDVEAIAGRAAAATRGPWAWRGNMDHEDPRLVGYNRIGEDGRVKFPGHIEVLWSYPRERTADDAGAKEYRRYLLETGCAESEADERVREEWLTDQWGEPIRDRRMCFTSPECFAVDAREAAVFAVAPDATRRDDPRVYRADIIDVRHPDARFIAHARQDVDDLLVELERTEGDLGVAVREASHHRALVAEAVKLHQADAVDPDWCQSCATTSWPCPTSVALAAADAPQPGPVKVTFGPRVPPSPARPADPPTTEIECGLCWRAANLSAAQLADPANAITGTLRMCETHQAMFGSLPDVIFSPGPSPAVLPEVTA